MPFNRGVAITYNVYLCNSKYKKVYSCYYTMELVMVVLILFAIADLYAHLKLSRPMPKVKLQARVWLMMLHQLTPVRAKTKCKIFIHAGMRMGWLWY
ncbi:MAG: hypothetical protein ABI763_02275 [Bacteroidota bacterium]